MACGRTLGNPAWHDDIHAGVVAMEHTVHRVKSFEGAAVHRLITRARGDAHAHRSFAIEFPVSAAADVPETLHAARHDVVVGAAQVAVRAEAHECGEHQRR